MPPRAPKAAPAPVPELPPIPAPTATDVVVAQTLALHQAVETLCFKAADGQPLSPDEYLVISTLFPERVDQERVMEKYARIREQQARAGTPAERKSVQDQLDEAEAALRTQAPEIRQRIGELQRQLQRLESAPTAPRVRLQEMAKAVNDLQNDDWYRPPIVEVLLRSRDDYRRRFHQPLYAARQRSIQLRGEIDVLRKYSPSQHAGRKLPSDNPVDIGVYATIDRLHLDRMNPQSIAAYIAQAERELETVAADLARMEPAEAALIAETESLRNRYVPQDPAAA